MACGEPSNCSTLYNIHTYICDTHIVFNVYTHMDMVLLLQCVCDMVPNWMVVTGPYS